MTEEEKSKLPEKVGVVADLIRAKRRVEGRGCRQLKRLSTPKSAITRLYGPFQRC